MAQLSSVPHIPVRFTFIHFDELRAPMRRYGSAPALLTTAAARPAKRRRRKKETEREDDVLLEYKRAATVERWAVFAERYWLQRQKTVKRIARSVGIAKRKAWGTARHRLTLNKAVFKEIAYLHFKDLRDVVALWANGALRHVCSGNVQLWLSDKELQHVEFQTLLTHAKHLQAIADIGAMQILRGCKFVIFDFQETLTVDDLRHIIEDGYRTEQNDQIIEHLGEEITSGLLKTAGVGAGSVIRVRHRADE